MSAHDRSPLVEIYDALRPLNASWKGSAAQVVEITDSKHDLTWGRTKDDIGYLNVHELGDAALPGAFDETRMQGPAQS